MKISAKGRYALMAMVYLAQNTAKDEYITIISIAKHFDLSKIYLEQVFASLKKANLVQSTKGSNGGYQLSRVPHAITVRNILESIELGLFEKNTQEPSDNAMGIEKAAAELVYDKVDEAIENILSDVTLYDLVARSEKYSSKENLMFYI